MRRAGEPGNARRASPGADRRPSCAQRHRVCRTSARPRGSADDGARGARRRLRGPLHGLPITVKDVFNVRDMPLRAGARAPLPEITPDEATAVARLRQAGALILAKTNLQEIALGLTGRTPGQAT